MRKSKNNGSRKKSSERCSRRCRSSEGVRGAGAVRGAGPRRGQGRDKMLLNVNITVYVDIQFPTKKCRVKMVYCMFCMCNRMGYAHQLFWRLPSPPVLDWYVGVSLNYGVDPGTYM